MTKFKRGPNLAANKPQPRVSQTLYCSFCGKKQPVFFKRQSLAICTACCQTAIRHLEESAKE